MKRFKYIIQLLIIIGLVCIAYLGGTYSTRYKQNKEENKSTITTIAVVNADTGVIEDGYLTISAAKGLDKDEQDEDGKYIRRERYSGQCQRSFYVGDAINEEDIKAKFEDGILKLEIPKKDAKAVEQKKYIAIEG